MASLLVVDDDVETCRFMQELLAAPDRTVDVAERADQVLALLAERRFDVVVSDINLGGDVTGLDLLRADGATNFA